MTVNELVEKLRNLDENAEVVTQATYSGPNIFTDVTHVDIDPDTKEVRLYGRD